MLPHVPDWYAECHVRGHYQRPALSASDVSTRWTFHIVQLSKPEQMIPAKYECELILLSLLISIIFNLSLCFS